MYSLSEIIRRNREAAAQGVTIPGVTPVGTATFRAYQLELEVPGNARSHSIGFSVGATSEAEARDAALAAYPTATIVSCKEQPL